MGSYVFASVNVHTHKQVWLHATIFRSGKQYHQEPSNHQNINHQARHVIVYPSNNIKSSKHPKASDTSPAMHCLTPESLVTLRPHPWRWQRFKVGRYRGRRKPAVHMHMLVRPAQGTSKEEGWGGADFPVRWLVCHPPYKELHRELRPRYAANPFISLGTWRGANQASHSQIDFPMHRCLVSSASKRKALLP